LISTPNSLAKAGGLHDLILRRPLRKSCARKLAKPLSVLRGTKNFVLVISHCLNPRTPIGKMIRRIMRNPASIDQSRIKRTSKQKIFPARPKKY
jgi:hypothetical protein